MPDCDDERVFYLMPELRRSAIWAICGCTLIAALVLFLELQQPPKPLVERLAMASLVIVGAVWLSQYLLSRIKIDAGGVSKRVLWWWRLWPWEAFENGRVCQGIAQYSYKFPEQAWWGQRIELGLLSPDDAKEIDRLIQKIWRPPDAGPLPRQLKIQIKWPNSQKLLLSKNGIVVSKRNQLLEYGWSDIREITFWRLEPGRQDFRELHLALPCREVVLRRRMHQGSEVLNWTGASSEAISRYVQEFAPEECTHNFAMTGASTTINEVEARTSRIEKELESLKKSCWGPIILVVAATAFVVLGIPWPKNVLMSLLYCPMVYALFHVIMTQIRKLEQQLLQLNKEREQLLNCEQN